MLALGQISQREQEIPFFNYTTVDGVTTKGWNEVAVAHIIYAGYINNCYSKNLEPYYDFVAIYDEVEMCIFENKMEEILLPVLRCFEDSVLKKIQDSK